MSSKQLDSILSKVPPATAVNQSYTASSIETRHDLTTIKIPTDRIVAEIPKILKEEIRHYIRSHPRETERTVILRALKAINFNVEDSWLVDNRSRR